MKLFITQVGAQFGTPEGYEVVEVNRDQFTPHVLKDDSPRFFRYHDGAEPIQVPAPWNASEILTAKPGDALVSDKGSAGNPENPWVVDRGQFLGADGLPGDYSVDFPSAGLCVKTAPAGLATFQSLGCTPDEEVAVRTKEGIVKVNVSAGFNLAIGTRGEIWPMEGRIVARYKPAAK